MAFINCAGNDMHRPEMVLFDYGDTLAWEPAPDFLKGWRAVFQTLVKNPDGAAPEQAQRIADGLWRRFSGSRSLSASRMGGWEIHEWQQLRTVFGALGLESSLPLPEVEILLMENACPSHPHDGTAEMLDFLRGQGVRTGVISNIGWSGNALSHRLGRLFPGQPFEFVLASSEYGIRKPDPLLFQIALRRAGLPSEKTWYCGDNFTFDVRGAHGAGIFPVWLNRTEQEPEEANFPYLAVSGWGEFTNIFEISK